VTQPVITQELAIVEYASSPVREPVKDQKIRRDALIAFGMLLATAIVIVWITFHFGGSALSHALTPVLSTTTGKIISGSAAVTIAAAGRVLLRRRRNRHPAFPPPQLSTAPTATTNSTRNTTQDSSEESEEKDPAESSAATH
jgi:hypothetical protein